MPAPTRFASAGSASVAAPRSGRRCVTGHLELHVAAVLLRRHGENKEISTWMSDGMMEGRASSTQGATRARPPLEGSPSFHGCGNPPVIVSVRTQTGTLTQKQGAGGTNLGNTDIRVSRGIPEARSAPCSCF